MMTQLEAPNQTLKLNDVTYRLSRTYERGATTGAVVLVCDHESRGLEDYLTDTGHEYAAVICSSTHIHLTERDCLEVIVVRGDATRIRGLVEKLRRRRGVKQARLTVVSP